MKYIKTVYEHSINEELNLKISWKQIIIGLCIFAAYKHYFPAKKNLTLSEMNRIVADVDNKPTLKEKVAIDAIKNSLISDLKQDNKISEYEEKLNLITEFIKLICYIT